MERIIPLLKQYRYGVLVVLIGICLMLIPDQSHREETAASTAVSVETDLQVQLQEILGQIQGVGKARVLLTESVGETAVYQQNVDSDADSRKEDTVLITDENRREKGLVMQVIPPRYLGAVVVCQGADRAAVRLAVVEAVSAVTGLTADKITVMKMK